MHSKLKKNNKNGNSKKTHHTHLDNTYNQITKTYTRKQERYKIVKMAMSTCVFLKEKSICVFLNEKVYLCLLVNLCLLVSSKLQSLLVSF